MTLIELMVTLAVVAVVVTVAVPSFLGMLQNNRASAEANRLVGTLKLARSEAIKRSTPVAVCAANADQTNCSGANTWSANGWIMILDPDGTAGTLDSDDSMPNSPDDTVLRNYAKPAGSPTIADGGDDFVRFVPSGALDDDSHAAAVTLTVTHSSCKGDQVRNLSISPSGQATLYYSACPST